MPIKLFLAKVKRKLWEGLVQYLRRGKLYIYIYRSYWHYLLRRGNGSNKVTCYFGAVPNQGAGIGHQIANWIAGYWFAQQFGLQFAHIPFSSEKWELFLGFGEDEISVRELVSVMGYRRVLLPLFEETKMEEIGLIKKIIDSYAGQQVVFIAEQDQFYRDQFGVMADLKRKFYQAKARRDDQLIYSKDNFNIAIHVRRGDIAVSSKNMNPNLEMRWQDNDYFKKVLSLVIKNIKVDKPIAIFLFSQGKPEDFVEFEKFANVHLCLYMGAQSSFLHMIFADLLITSKSSFSYKPALLSNGIKICPYNFWHNYPPTPDFILVDDGGIFETTRLFVLVEK